MVATGPNALAAFGDELLGIFQGYLENQTFEGGQGLAEGAHPISW